MGGLEKFIREIHRRSLWQVLAIYLAGSWVAFEVVGEITEAAALPDWVPGVALVLLIIGLPVVLATAFVQEGVGGGPEPSPTAPPPHAPGDGTAPSTEGAGSAAVAGSRAGSAPPTRGASSLFTWRNAVVGGLGGFTLLGIATAASIVLGVARGHGTAPAELDENAVMVAPFRVSGSDELAYLGEGMVDLLAAKLSGEGGPRALDARTVLAAWHESTRSGSEDLTQDEASSLALRLGAPRVLMGTVVGQPSRLTISATLVDATEGTQLFRSEEVGPADSLPSLVDRLAAEVLGRSAGYDPVRLAVVTSASLPALQAYLRGMRSYRRGNFADAVEAFQRAHDTDTTFVLAGLMQAYALGWEGFGPNYTANLRRAWEQRDRLPPLERAMVELQVDSTYPPARPWATQIGPAEDIAERWPRSPEAWYMLGETLWHGGIVLGEPDAFARARTAFGRALEIDSTFGPALRHALEMAALDADTAATRRLGARYLGGDLERETSAMGWLTYAVVGDEDRAARVHDRLDTLDAQELATLATFALLAAAPDETTDRAAEMVVSRARGAPSPLPGLATAGAYFIETGRPRRMAEVSRTFPGGFADLYTVYQSIHGDVPEDIAAAAESSVVELEGSESSPLFSRLTARCFLSLRWAVEGDAERATSMLARLRERQREGLSLGPDSRRSIELCSATAALWLDDSDGGPGPARIEAVESALARTNLGPAFTDLAIHAISDAWERRGDLDAALTAIRRLSRVKPQLRAPSLLREARLAARLGRIEEARRAYLAYLALRTDPEPGPAAEAVAQARAELAALTPN
jgi:tetratricopeptide (TPR) repeat protein/TolB-like protein